VALTGAGAAAGLIDLLDGSRDRAQLVAAAAQLGIPVPLAERLLTLLAGAGLLIDYPAAVLRALPADRRARLLPELAAASLARQDTDGGAAVLARRCAASVRIDGTGRVAAGITEILAAAGVEVATGGGRRGRRPALLILAGQPPDPAARLPDVPHLAVSAREAIGMVGPLVRPGVSACLRCLDLTRANRDPGWPLILAQVSRRQAEPVACGAVLAAAVAAQAAAQALAFVDCPAAAGPAENATLELVLPGWQWRRRGWPPHPACTCRASDGYVGGYGKDGDSG
jgi:bacteriocin biosynthesis cyclodehydratase domain-containing protein